MTNEQAWQKLSKIIPNAQLYFRTITNLQGEFGQKKTIFEYEIYGGWNNSSSWFGASWEEAFSNFEKGKSGAENPNEARSRLWEHN